MEERVYERIADIVSALQLRSWFDRSQASLTEQTYGSQLLWRYLDRRRPRLLPGYLRWLATRRPDESAAAGLAAEYRRLSGQPFPSMFGRFAAWIAGEYADRIAPLRTLEAGTQTGGRLRPLSIHFLRIPRSAAALHVRVTVGRPTVALVYERVSAYAGRAPSTRHLPGRAANGALVFRIPPSLRQSPRFGMATLVVANGDPSRAAAYSVAVGRNAPPEWGKSATKGAA
jgi:hypothetical protein